MRCGDLGRVLFGNRPQGERQKLVLFALGEHACLPVHELDQELELLAVRRGLTKPLERAQHLAAIPVELLRQRVEPVVSSDQRVEMLATKVNTGLDLHACFVEQCSRSEEHTSELQSRENLVCRLLLEKKKPIYISAINLYSRF